MCFDLLGAARRFSSCRDLLWKETLYKYRLWFDLGLDQTKDLHDITQHVYLVNILLKPTFPKMFWVLKPNLHAHYEPRPPPYNLHAEQEPLKLIMTPIMFLKGTK